MRSDNGFSVQFTGRFDAEYTESNNTVTLYVESGIEGGLQCIILEPNAFERWDNGQAISATQQEKMFQNFKDAMEFQGLKMVVQRGQIPNR